METWEIIRDVVLTLAVAMVFGGIMQLLRQSPIVGYLIAGVLIGGPGSVGLIEHVEAVEDIAELGVALLLFTIGTDFSWEKLKRFGRSAAIAGVMQIVATTLVTILMVTVVGQPLPIAIVAGMVVALSSTAVVVRVLQDRAQIDSVQGLATVGILLVQDIALVPFLLIVPDLDSSLQLGAIASTFAVSLGKVLVLVGAMYVIDYILLARAFYHASGRDREEFLTLISMVVAVGAAWATHSMGLSAALGAFVAGILIGGAPYADQVRSEVNSIRTALVTLFFASMGMLADVRFVGEHLMMVIGVAVGVIVLKSLVGAAALRGAGNSWYVAVLGGAALAQMGEFSFVIATAAYNSEILDEFAFQLVVAVSLLTLLATPYLIQAAGKLARRLPEAAQDPAQRKDPILEGHVIVAGYGITGQRVVERLHERGRELAVIELNPVQRSREAPPGVVVIQGDAARRSALRRAGIEHAAAVVVTVPDTNRARAITSRIRRQYPELPIVARGRYHAYIEELHAVGVNAVVDEEIDCGNRLSEEALRALGAPM